MNIFTKFGMLLEARGKSGSTPDKSFRDSRDFDLEDYFSKASYGLWNVVNKMREVSESRELQYEEYDMMEKDILISSALEMYADDATQPDENGKIIFIRSKNASLQKTLEDYLLDLDINSRLWDWAYQLAKYGDLYLERYKDNDGKLINYVDEYHAPARLFDLTRYGKTEHFAILKDSDKNNGSAKKMFEIVDPKQFVHFYVRKSSTYEKVPIDDTENRDEDGNPRKIIYKVNRGVSMMENLRSGYRIVKLLEDSMIVSRLAKSALIRMFLIEVGNLPPKKVQKMIAKFKGLIDSQERLDLERGDYKSIKTPSPIDDALIIPTKNGIGAISQQQVGGDVNVSSIVDIDHFRNKLFAGLKIPKPFMGFEETLPGSIGNTSLTKLDIRYSRTVKRLQKALAEGIRTLLNLYLIDTGKESEINNFEVSLVKPTTSEDNDRLNDLDIRMRTVQSIIDTLDKFEEISYNKAEVLKFILTYILQIPELERLIFTSGSKSESETAEEKPEETESQSETLSNI